MIVIEFIGALCMVLIMVWQSTLEVVEDLADVTLSETHKRYIMAGTVVAMMPTVWIRSYSKLFFISFVGFISTVSIIVVVCYAFIRDPSIAREHSYKTFDSDNFAVGAGIFTVSLGGQACLPGIYNDMRHKDQYSFMINTCFVVMFVCYAVMGSAGYLLYGDDCQVLITSNLKNYPGGTMSRVVTMLVMVSTFSSIGPIVSVISEVPESILGMSSWRCESAWSLSMRTATLLLCCAASVAAYDYLGYVESLVGGVCTMCTSLIFPALFYYKLFKGQLGTGEKVLNLMIGLLGLVGATYIATSDTWGIIRQLMHSDSNTR